MISHKILLVICTISMLPGAWLNTDGTCSRTPEGVGAPKTSPDGRFRIRIFNSPTKYKPNGIYNVTLAGIKMDQKTHPFVGFFLTVERKNDEFTDGAGHFRLIDKVSTRFSEKCNSVITHTTNAQKEAVTVEWYAPPRGSGCVLFLATVIEHRDVWYMDDGQLIRELCEDEEDTEDADFFRQPQECCACTEARYTLEFTGAWTAHTHPRKFPEDPFSVRFSDIIGATHTEDFKFWEPRTVASDAVRSIAESGDSHKLENLLKSEAYKVRTVIKAQGPTHPNITTKSLAVLRLDSRRHFVSFISKMVPSPDWIVGIHAIDLCLPNCTWIERKVQKLYPWDAGTQSGTDYMSSPMPTVPPDFIRKIRFIYGSDPRSPFYNLNGDEMNPVAYITIRRERLFDESCEDFGRNRDRYNSNPYQNTNDNNNNNYVKNNADECETTPWSPWSECECVQRKQFRRRNYKLRYSPEQGNCNKNLEDVKDCYCDSVDDKIDEPKCALSNWLEWSSCSNLCGQGIQNRTRHYLEPKFKYQCEAGSQNRPVLIQHQPCVGEICGGNIPDQIPRYCFQHPDQGHCRNFKPLWFYDQNTSDCAIFDYGGCGGNKNRFTSRETCLSNCSSDGDDRQEESNERYKFSNNNANFPRSYQRNSNVQSKFDCEYSDWEAGTCNATCGDEGFQLLERTVLRGGGRCTDRLTRLEPCRGLQCDQNEHEQRRPGGFRGYYN